MTQKVKAIMGLGLVAGLGAAVLPLASYADTATSEGIVKASVEESITITGLNDQATGLAFSGSEISAGTVEKGFHEVTISTSAANGYTLAMKSSAAALKLESDPTGAANVFDGAEGFAGIGAGDVTAAANSADSLAALTTGFSFASTAPATGTWGYRLGDTQAGGVITEGSVWTAGKFVSVPTSDFVIAASNAASASRTVLVTFGAQAGTTTPAGSYGAKITYTATTK